MLNSVRQGRKGQPVLSGWRLEVLVSCVVGMTAVLLFGLVFKVWNGSLKIPFTYAGDAEANLMFAKTIIDHGWVQENPSLGAPFGQVMYDYPLGGDNLNFGLMWIISWFTDNPAVVVNGFFILTFALIASSSYLALRVMTVHLGLAWSLAVLYAFLPFHLIRGEAHLLLGAYFALPWAVVIGLRAFEGRLPRRFREDWKGWGLLGLSCIVIGSTGAYMLVFGVLIILTLGTAGATRKRSWPLMARCLLIVGAIISVGLANQSQSIIYSAMHGENAAVGEREPSESELYGLKLTALFVPTDGHRIPAFADFAQRYNGDPTSQTTSGASTEPLGVVGSTGVILMLFVVPFLALAGVQGQLRKYVNDLAPFALGTFACVMVSTVGGLASLFAIIVTSQIRGWDRIELLVAFLALAGLGLTLTGVLKRARKKLTRRGHYALSAILVAGLLAVGLADQATSVYVPKYSANEAQYVADRSFVEEATALIGSDAVVLQLPTVEFPEVPPPDPRVGPYSNVRPYLHAPESIRWSYGAMKGRATDIAGALTKLPVPELVVAGVAAGFTTIWIDRFGYPEGTNTLETGLQAVLGPPVLVRPDGRYAVYTLTPIAESIGAIGTDLRYAGLHPFDVSPGVGMTAVSWASVGIQGNAEGVATFGLSNAGGSQRAARIRAHVLTPSVSAGRIDVKVGPRSATLAIVAGEATLDLTTTLSSATTTALTFRVLNRPTATIQVRGLVATHEVVVAAVRRIGGGTSS